MGCGLSSFTFLRSSSAKRQHTSDTIGQDQAPVTFHPFLKLPYELRRQVWTECLSSQCPRAYPLDLSITTEEGRGQFDRSLHWLATSVEFVPTSQEFSGAEELQDLIAGTAPSRILGSTCREAREVVFSVFPDTFEMRADPRSRTRSYKPRHYYNASRVPYGFFRFNAKRDIIILHSVYPNDIRRVVEWGIEGGNLDCFQPIQHLAINLSCLQDDVYFPDRCGCGSPDCVKCSRDPLLGLFRLFPRLVSFHLAQVDFTYYFNERSNEKFVETVKPCECDANGPGIKHDWPLFKGMAEHAWYVSYPDDGSDCFPPLPWLCRRADHRPKWPHYNALSNLDIRLLRRMTLGKDYR